METILWALNLVALAGLCMWALRKDKAEADQAQADRAAKAAGPAAQLRRKD